jgi:hypothetical protein
MSGQSEVSMSNDPKGARARADANLDKAQRTTDEAKALADFDLNAARTKTARLRKLRFAKEAREGVTELDTAPKPKKAKTKSRASD